MTFCFYFTKIGIQIYFHSGSSVMISISSNFVIWKSGSNYIYPFINLSVVSTILRVLRRIDSAVESAIWWSVRSVLPCGRYCLIAFLFRETIAFSKSGVSLVLSTFSTIEHRKTIHIRREIWLREWTREIFLAPLSSLALSFIVCFTGSYLGPILFRNGNIFQFHRVVVTLTGCQNESTRVYFWADPLRNASH